MEKEQKLPKLRVDIICTECDEVIKSLDKGKSIGEVVEHECAWNTYKELPLPNVKINEG